MPNVENLVMDSELGEVIDRVIALEGEARKFWDRRVFKAVLKGYCSLHLRINNLNISINNHNRQRENRADYDTGGEILLGIRKEKITLAEEAEEIRIILRRRVVDRKMDRRYGKWFIRRFAQYEEAADFLQDYLKQEATGKNMPKNGEARAERLRSERGY
jgi:hypothetical protein